MSSSVLAGWLKLGPLVLAHLSSGGATRSFMLIANPTHRRNWIEPRKLDSVRGHKQLNSRGSTAATLIDCRALMKKPHVASVHHTGQWTTCLIGKQPSPSAFNRTRIRLWLLQRLALPLFPWKTSVTCNRATRGIKPIFSKVEPGNMWFLTPRTCRSQIRRPEFAQLIAEIIKC